VAAVEVIDHLRRMHNPKSVNRMAQVAAAAALEDLGYYRRYVSEVKCAAALTQRFCDARGVPCRLSHANFVLIGLENPHLAARRLREAGVHVRDRSTQLPGMIRLTVGTVEQMREVLSILERALSGCDCPPIGLGTQRPEPVRAVIG
jgi:histidinol-phosphate aminotransferase